ncbi:hypothetical protein ACFCX0_47785, partial [Streptomyces sp. NPDC056352]|uniref:hypothetical protein n=1 Tax=Streptomyces sp. NPDC056352 TaxID=3345791 RepID=UPI0035DD551E
MRAKRHGDREAVRALRRERRTLPSQDPNDPGYRPLRYVRYCDGRQRQRQGGVDREHVDRCGRLLRLPHDRHG